MNDVVYYGLPPTCGNVIARAADSNFPRYEIQCLVSGTKSTLIEEAPVPTAVPCRAAPLDACAAADNERLGAISTSIVLDAVPLVPLLFSLLMSLPHLSFPPVFSFQASSFFLHPSSISPVPYSQG